MDLIPDDRRRHLMTFPRVAGKYKGANVRRQGSPPQTQGRKVYLGFIPHSRQGASLLRGTRFSRARQRGVRVSWFARRTASLERRGIKVRVRDRGALVSGPWRSSRGCPAARSKIGRDATLRPRIE